VPASAPIIVNGSARPVPAAGTLTAVLEEAGLAGRPVAVEVDGEIVPRGRFHDRGKFEFAMLKVVRGGARNSAATRPSAISPTIHSTTRQSHPTLPALTTSPL
jgi:thiamine biosynthesis protein ThiS